MTRAGSPTIKDPLESEVRKLGGITPRNRTDPQTYVNLVTAMLNDSLMGRIEKTVDFERTTNRLIDACEANTGIPYDEAAALAIRELEKKITEEPDFFTGTDSKLNIGADELAGNEYQGIDGQVYVVGDDGNFRPRD